MTQDHSNLMKEITEHFQPLLDQSPEGIYLWLDDEHMLCNDKLASLFGYDDAHEMASAGPFLETFVAPSERERFANNYAKCITKMSFPITFKFQAIKKDGGNFEVETVMIPLLFSNHLLAYHFVRLNQ